MTNMEYIISRLDERTLASLFFNRISSYRVGGFEDKVLHAFYHWANSFSENKGNCAYNTHTGESYENTDKMPSVWSWEYIFKKPGIRVRHGRSMNVSFQVWLISQYNERGEWDV